MHSHAIPMLDPTLLSDSRPIVVRWLGAVALALIAAIALFLFRTADQPNTPGSGTLTPASAGAASVNVPELPAQKQKLDQGLTLTFEALLKPFTGVATDVRDARLVMLRIPEGAAPTPFLPPGPVRATFDGFINLKLRDSYTFTFEGRGSAQLKINNELVLDAKGDDLSATSSKPTKLNKGKNAFTAVFDSPAKGDAWVRLTWSGEDFAREPLQPDVFTHDISATPLRQANRLRAGRELFAELRCLKCHVSDDATLAKGQGMPELAMDAPDLADAGARLRLGWLARWINNPHALRPDSPMPRIFSAARPDDAAVDPRAWDVAAYLASLGGKGETAAEPVADDEAIGAGGRLFTGLGCIACHVLPDHEKVDGEVVRIPLQFVKAKFQSGAVKQFLLKPEGHFAWIKMPNPKLTEAEAGKIASFLLSKCKDDLAAPADVHPDVSKGQQLVEATGCLNCHTSLKLVNAAKTPSLAELNKLEWTKGCMATDVNARGKAPDHQLTGDARAALLAVTATDFTSFTRDSGPEVAERQIKSLNCLACHSRDGRDDPWTGFADEIQAIESQLPGQPEVHEGLTPEQFRPHLTWIGEKLKPEWFSAFVAGDVKYKPRTWIYARMPAFPARAKLLAEGLALEHGCPTTSPVDLKPEEKMADSGCRLIGKDGLSCISCHGVGEMKPIGTFETVGINFVYTNERIRHDYYTRWIRDPGRVEPGTRMPKFGDSDGKTALKQFFDGDATQQFESIWHYLQTSPKMTPPE